MSTNCFGGGALLMFMATWSHTLSLNWDLPGWSALISFPEPSVETILSSQPNSKDPPRWIDQEQVQTLSLQMLSTKSKNSPSEMR